MIVITTPTGRIGREVVENVLQSGTAVRVIVRDPARLPPHVRDRVEVVPGSHSDVDVLMKAFAGADSVFWLIPPNPRAESVQEHVLDFVRPLCAAVNRQGIARVVAVSTLGRGITRNAGQVSATYAMDDLIESTGVHYRSLCPPTFMENLLGQAETIGGQGAFFSPMPGDRRFPTCAVRDIAAAAARVLLDRSWTGQESVPIVGPDDLSSDEMAQIMTEVLQRPVRFQQVSGEAFEETLVRAGMSEAWAQGMVSIQTATDRAVSPPVARNAPTSFREWCEATLKPAASPAP